MLETWRPLDHEQGLTHSIPVFLLFFIFLCCFLSRIWYKQIIRTTGVIKEFNICTMQTFCPILDRSFIVVFKSASLFRPRRSSTLATWKSSNKGKLKKNSESEEILFNALKIKGTRSKIGLVKRYSSINIANLLTITPCLSFTEQYTEHGVMLVLCFRWQSICCFFNWFKLLWLQSPLCSTYTTHGCYQCQES